MQVFNLSEKATISNVFIAEMRDVQLQQDRARFRRNMARIGQILAYEISKTLPYASAKVETPLGVAHTVLPSARIVLCTVMRAGLPFHQGMLDYYDNADNAFIAAYRRTHKDGSFEIQLDYVSTPDLNGATLILTDPMLATGGSLKMALETLLRYGQPAAIHVAAIVASTVGVETVTRAFPSAHVWVGAIDSELTAKAYIVPGLGDAGDLAFGSKN